MDFGAVVAQRCSNWLASEYQFKSFRRLFPPANTAISVAAAVYTPSQPGAFQ